MDPSCLIVDDNVTYARALRIQLERDGFDVVDIAPNIAVALRDVEEYRPDVVLVDIRLDAESGVECARHIARVTPADPPVVILTSAYRLPDTVLQTTAPFPFLPKTQLLARRIGEILAGIRFSRP